jgi:hypothetical protein
MIAVDAETADAAIGRIVRSLMFWRRRWPKNFFTNLTTNICTASRRIFTAYYRTRSPTSLERTYPDQTTRIGLWHPLVDVSIKKQRSSRELADQGPHFLRLIESGD